MNKPLFLIFIITFTLLCSCAKEDKNNIEKSPDNNPDNNCSNKVVARNDSIIITGSCNFEPSLTFLDGGYLLTMSEKPYNALTSFEIYQKNLGSYMGAKASSGSALREDEWYSQAAVWTRIGGIWTWRVKATGPYKIVFAKLPLNVTPATVPGTYNSAGKTVLGPVHLSGSTTFTILCPDAKLAGFSANLIDASTGNDILAANYHNILDFDIFDENNKPINSFDVTITADMVEGNYLIEVSANNSANWTVKID